MAIKESSIITNIKRKVARIPNTRIKKLWSNQMNRDIDLLVVTNGLACFYEIKVPGETPTDWQTARLDWWKVSCADVGWFDNADACVERIQQMWLKGASVQQYLQMETAMMMQVTDQLTHGKPKAFVVDEYWKIIDIVKR